MNKMTMSLVGYGNMGASMVKGALKSGLLIGENIKVYDTDPTRADQAKKDGLIAVGDLGDLRGSDVVLLCVKPKQMLPLLDNLRGLFPVGSTLFISIAAGIRIATLESRLGAGSRVCRVMPNITASVNESASGFVTNRHAKDSDTLFIGALLKGVGLPFWLDTEDILDSVTGISGSGPAYFFKLMSAIVEAGKNEGLPPKLVRSMIAQTCKGAGVLALQTDQTFEELISTVASPGGTTEEALRVMDSKEFSKTVTEAISAAIEKSRMLGKS